MSIVGLAKRVTARLGNNVSKARAIALLPSQEKQ